MKTANRRTHIAAPAAVAALLLAFLHGGCRAAPAIDRSKLHESLARKRLEREAEIAAMTVEQMVLELQKESQSGLEPFNSRILRGLVDGKSAAEIKRVLDARPEIISHLGLLVLRRLGPELYGQVDPKLRAAVLIEAFKASKHFNAWGIPHLYWEDAAKALIAEGKSEAAGTQVRDALRALLEDRRDAPVWGSEESTISRLYRYRVRDYAWALLKAIEGAEVEVPREPAARDRRIERGEL